jgi:hypothetical protein
MRVDYTAIDGLQQYVDAMPEAATTAARIALNDTATGPGLALFRKATADSANFPPGYLTDKRLGVTKPARNADLATTITGRFRPTSLARFVRNPQPGVRGNIRVEVKRGHQRVLKRAFLVRLRQGASISNDNFNLGLAIRLKPGETLEGSSKALQLDKGLYLLYGPSVDQVFRNTSGEVAPQVLSLVTGEFFRQFFRLSRASR